MSQNAIGISYVSHGNFRGKRINFFTTEMGLKKLNYSWDGTT